MSKNVYAVQALGWGDSEDEFYNVAICSTKAKADAKVAELTEQWVSDNGDADGLVLQVESFELDA